MLAIDAHTMRFLRYPFFTEWINAPHGVNLMANTSVWTAGLVLTPVTLLLGPAVAFAAFTTVALAGTASAWYFVLSRWVAAPAAAVGGAVCGFGPGMVSHAVSQPNWAATFLL